MARCCPAPLATTRPEGSSAYRVLSNRDGRADWSWRIPEDAQPGVWTMTAQGEDSKVKQTIRFEVASTT